MEATVFQQCKMLLACCLDAVCQKYRELETEVLKEFQELVRASELVV